MTHSLNPEQQNAANHIEGPLLVIAGAGSGKTRIITHRIAHLLQIGVPAGEILAVTFTNKAAEEMRHRVRQMTHQQVLTCTFHSLGAKILRESIHLLGYKNQFSIYDEDDSLNLIKSCLKELGIDDDKSKLRSIKHFISQNKNDLKSPEKSSSGEYPSHEYMIYKQVYSHYQRKLKEFNACDFDDLLYLTVELLKTSAQAREHYESRWSFVLIDEYQDTNAAQYTLSRLLVNKHQNLFVVGDPDQSIYSWRGANIGNILNFETDFPSAKVVKLEQNYRSTNHILSAANSLIGHNIGRYEKNLWSNLGDGEKVKLKIHENEHEEALFIVDQIALIHKKLPYNNMVIFYRTNAQSRIFEDHLLKFKIPYQIIGGISFYQRREIKDILAFLKMIVSDTDFIAFSRTINTPKRGLGPTFLEKIYQLAQLNSVSILAACHKAVNEGFTLDMKISSKQQQALKDYLKIIEHLKSLNHSKASLKEILKELIERSSYLSYLKEDEETYSDRKENLDELISKAAEWEQENENPTLELFLEELSLKSSSDEKQKLSDSVKLMTLHNGKGLEFDVAFIVGLEEEILPHINSKDSHDQIEEERRLFYVGMTRAKKELFITSSKYRMLWGMPKIMTPSRFLEEIDESHLEYLLNKKTKPSFEFTDRKTFSPTLRECKEEFKGEFKIGTSVTHKDFGRGTIQKVYNTSLGTTYDVYFLNSKSTKSLVAKFAKLIND